MADQGMIAQVSEHTGFIAALDQSGGSTPGALRQYGVPDGSYGGDAEMFRLMHEMRVRIMTAPSFTGEKVIAAILFEQTMDGEAEGTKVPTYLARERGVVPFVKIDKGIEAERDGVQLLKPIPGLDALLERAAGLGVAGTKERSVIRLPDRTGIEAIVRQQFEVAETVSRHGLMPILEPEVLIKSPDKAGAERLLREAILDELERVPGDRQVMLKLTIPEEPDFYRSLIDHPRVARVVALSGGYDRAEACAKLAQNHGLIGSFSRALLEDLKRDMPEAEFEATLSRAIDEIYAASAT